jgi:hypothetical protein
LKGKPLYFAKTSGTTLGQNTFRFLKNRCRTILKARNAILLYIHETGKADFVEKMIFLQGSPVLEENTESSLVDYHCSTFYSQISTEK